MSDDRPQLTGFVVTPFGFMHAENHRRLIESLPPDSSWRRLLEQAKPCKASDYYLCNKFER